MDFRKRLGVPLALFFCRVMHWIVADNCWRCRGDITVLSDSLLEHY